MDRLRYSRADQFAYQFIVATKPLSVQANRSNLARYRDTIRVEAEKNIDSKITSSDIEIEITWTCTDKAGIRSDIDNIIKPIVDALVGVAYNDDKQIRTVVAVFVDRNQQHKINGYVEDLKGLFFSRDTNVVQVTIYSDEKLAEKGGADILRKQFLNKKLPGMQL